MSKGDDDGELGEYADSDSDPAWTPYRRDDLDDEDGESKRGRKPKQGSFYFFFIHFFSFKVCLF